MNTETLPQPADVGARNEWVHCVCVTCTDSRAGVIALCGEDTSGDAWVDGGEAPLELVCPLCLAILEQFQGCPQGCPL